MVIVSLLFSTKYRHNYTIQHTGTKEETDIQKDRLELGFKNKTQSVKYYR